MHSMLMWGQEEDAEGGQALRARRKQMYAAHAAFAAPVGDAISALRALCAYEASGCSEQFCRCAALPIPHLASMKANFIGNRLIPLMLNKWLHVVEGPSGSIGPCPQALLFLPWSKLGQSLQLDDTMVSWCDSASVHREPLQLDCM